MDLRAQVAAYCFTARARSRRRRRRGRGRARRNATGAAESEFSRAEITEEERNSVSEIRPTAAENLGPLVCPS